jgi:hypothetical protein
VGNVAVIVAHAAVMSVFQIEPVAYRFNLRHGDHRQNTGRRCRNIVKKSPKLPTNVNTSTNVGV